MKNIFKIFVIFSVIFIGFIKFVQADFPSNELLEELKKRILEKPKCLPHCFDFNQMNLEISDKEIKIILQVHALTQVAVPLPIMSKSWQNILLDNQSMPALLKEPKDNDSILWGLVSEGIHEIILINNLENETSFQVSMPVKSHFVNIKNEKWDIQGIHKDGKMESTIQLTRIKETKETKEEKENNQGLVKKNANISPFLQVERVLELGVTWQVSTSVKRLTPKGLPIMCYLPLLDGESVTTGGIHVENNQVLLNMDAKTDFVTWTAVLKNAPEILLKANKEGFWTESWILDASPIWHCEFSGIPVIHHQNQEGEWKPQWMPWPGEEVLIKISRPEAVLGQIITIDSAKLEITPGVRIIKSSLSLDIRSSKGFQKEIILPKSSNLQIVKINNLSQPIKQENQKVTIPIQPGFQQVYLEWTENFGFSCFFKASQVQIGQEAVNARVKINIPSHRWVLWTHGPRLGPAVLFWGYLFFVIFLSISLGKANNKLNIIQLDVMNTRQWFLLCLGLTQIEPIQMFIIIAWFFVLGIRKIKASLNFANKWFIFNIMQLGLVIWTFVAFVNLYEAIQRGLLGSPKMRILGNGSNNLNLNWTQDRILDLMPQPLIISMPGFIYNIIMLLWAIWIAFSLLKWLKWAWSCFSEGQIFKKWRSKIQAV